MRRLLPLFFAGIILLIACKPEPSATNNPQKDTQATVYNTIGEIVKLDNAMDDYLAPGSKIQILGEGFNWSEGPVWIETGGYLLFSDVPENTIYKWKEGEGINVYLKPSGATGLQENSSGEGSNGLMLDGNGNLLLCQHGDRRIAQMNTTPDNPKPQYVTLADNYQGKKFNSPNDLAVYKDGSIYFTDPPYGLPNWENSPLAELDFRGVFRVDTKGLVSLLTDKLSLPNGIAFSPDYSICYVNVSDPSNPVIMAYPVKEDGTFGEGSVLFDTKPIMVDGPGLPDGLRVHPSGVLFSSGPGGILLISPEGKHLGTINTTQATANCCFDARYEYLYMTADQYLLRVPIVH
ncbi:MAG: SMP-30/gluconolactonase/LRE family protein [Bacteroidales bacterium]|nr:SMP-30/gluconolactonase/LRE family protein [Bacteroidales bacterium]